MGSGTDGCEGTGKLGGVRAARAKAAGGRGRPGRDESGVRQGRGRRQGRGGQGRGGQADGSVVNKFKNSRRTTSTADKETRSGGRAREWVVINHMTCWRFVFVVASLHSSLW